jgi:hypothetical protein
MEQVNNKTEEAAKTYRIVRYHFNKENEVLKRHVTLEEAQEHCNNERTSNLEEGWFDGFTEE